MRVKRAPAPGPGVPVPAGLREFAEPHWYDPAEPVPPDLVGDWDPLTWRRVSAVSRWSAARREWAAAHGFDPDAPYGGAPGADWWAFLAVCAGRDPGWSPRSLDELNACYVPTAGAREREPDPRTGWEVSAE